MYDLKVRQAVEQIIRIGHSTTLLEFKAEFWEKLKLIPQMSAYSCEHSYVLLRKEFYLQVCHRNVKGERDRVLLDVFSIKEESEC